MGWKSRRGRMGRYAGLFVLSQLLEFLAARQDAASVLLSPGPHLSMGLLALVSVMLMGRLAVHLLLPGLVAAELADALCFRTRSPPPEPASPPPGRG